MADPAPNPSPAASSDDPPRRGPRVVESDRSQGSHRRPSTIVDRLLLQHGTANAALKALAMKKIRLDEQVASLSEENDVMKAKSPAKDAVVLTGDDAKKWNAVKAIDLPGDKIAERVKLADTLEQQTATAERTKKVGEIATAANMNADVLAPLLTQFGLEVELRPVTVVANGKTETKQVPHIRTAPKSTSDNPAWEALSDYVAKDGSTLKPFAAALVKSGIDKPRPGQSAPGLPFPDQSGQPGGDDGSSVLDKILAGNKARAEQKNPLTAPMQQTGVMPIVGGVPSHSMGNKKVS